MFAAKNIIRDIIRHILRKLPAYSFSVRDKQTDSPLLDRADILDLLYRVQDINSPTEHFRDVAHRMFGDARSVYRGYGMDYEESRPYQPGDELRFMNWRLTARTGTPYMKVFREERRPGVFIVLDRRHGMRFGSRLRLKVTQAVRTTAIAAFNAQKQNIPVGGVFLEAHTRWFREQGGEQAAFNLIHEASTACPPVFTHVDEPTLGHTLKLLLSILTQGSRVYIISDFSDISDNERPTLMQLCTDHQVYAIHITDPAEQQLASMGKLRFSAQGNQGAISIDTSNTTTRRAYEETVQRYMQARKQLFVSMGIPYIQIQTDEQDIETKIPLV